MWPGFITQLKIRRFSTSKQSKSGSVCFTVEMAGYCVDGFPVSTHKMKEIFRSHVVSFWDFHRLFNIAELITKSYWYRVVYPESLSST